MTEATETIAVYENGHVAPAIESAFKGSAELIHDFQARWKALEAYAIDGKFPAFIEESKIPLIEAAYGVVFVRWKEWAERLEAALSHAKTCPGGHDMAFRSAEALRGLTPFLTTCVAELKAEAEAIAPKH
ncbi:hypothetical protein SBC1_31380 [Caballeronia sp. SBC1]|uniref:hypothetical protein n=1 Tax=Caballeronia sp. SBC1 TaxID=2705548 RepID=UPI00140BE9FB|nr:hypothetical protein [Caballeronia sp. SBC1]QIN63114.1 hypothetical protein SBC1_31380 [Caballeronia sp. SBC1]